MHTPETEVVATAVLRLDRYPEGGLKGEGGLGPAMTADRRTFLRMMAGLVTLLSGGVARARTRAERWDIHQATRNTRLGAALRLLRPRPSDPLPPPYKLYEGKPRVALPSLAARPGRAFTQCVRQWRPNARFSHEPIQLAELGRLLYLTNGITTDSQPGRSFPELRAAPSAGALYAGEVYVVAERVLGLDSGVYYYAVRGHELVQVERGSVIDVVAEAQRDPAGIEGAAAAILLTNVFARYASGYGNRGYRYALIDSGHIGENLRIAAESAGLGSYGTLAFYDELLNGLLGIDGREEAVCGVHVVGRRGGGAMAAGGEELKRSFVERQDSPSVVIRTAPITERYHAATMLIPEAGVKSQSLPEEITAQPRVGPGIALPKPSAGPQMNTEAAIRIRRSTRRFLPEPVPLAQLGYVVEMAKGHPALERCGGVDLWVAVHRVSDLAPGLYRYQPTRHRLLLIRDGALGSDLVGACLGQQKAGAAAAAFFMVAGLGRNGAHASSRRYRDMLLESGSIGQRIYLAAEAAGLSARNLAAFRDDDLNRLLGFDGMHEAVVHLTLLGPGD